MTGCDEPAMAVGFGTTGWSCLFCPANAWHPLGKTARTKLKNRPCREVLAELLHQQATYVPAAPRKK